jgi:8-oxo-dGTP diphosphatase
MVVMVDVVCALIVEMGEVWIVQHGPDSKHPGKWEFPGGKVQPGESPEEALVREIREELILEGQINKPLQPGVFSYPDKTIRLIPFLCSRVSGDLILNEHAGFERVKAEQLSGFDLLEADRALLEIRPNEEALLSYISKTGF